MSPDAVWWEKRARLRYRQWQEAETRLERVEKVLEKHADCWPDDWCRELASDVRDALNGGDA